MCDDSDFDVRFNSKDALDSLWLIVNQCLLLIKI